MKRELYSPMDPKCRELADYFVPPDTDDSTRGGMAQNIQDLVDDWLLDIAQRKEQARARTPRRRR